MRKSGLPILLLIGAFSSLQCVETLITVKVFPNGQYLVNFTTRGDSADVFDHDFPHPTGSQWSNRVRKETASDDSNIIWIQESEALLTDTSFLPTASPAPLAHPLTVVKQEGLFSTTYSLEQTFIGRRAYQKYPEFAKSLDSQLIDKDSTRWIAEALYYMVTEAMNDLQADTSLSIAPSLLERIQNHLRGVFYRVNERSMYEDLSRWQIFLQSSLKPFLAQLPSHYLPALLTAVQVYREELIVTNGLQDDNFIYQALLPGRVIETNADSIFGDTLKWYFTLEDFINDDYKIQASSILYSTRRIQAGILVAALVVLGILIYLYKKRSTP
jgi:hypothetical protein